MSTVCITNGLNRAVLLQKPQHQGKPIYHMYVCLLKPSTALLVKEYLCIQQHIYFYLIIYGAKAILFISVCLDFQHQPKKKSNQVDTCLTTNRPDD